MSDLEEMQMWMAARLRHRRALPGDAAIAAEARLHVSGNDRLSPVEQLEIYREQFWLRHTASLLEDFPGLSGIIGQEHWERLVESYLGEVVPRSYTLRDLGSELPAHVERATWLPHHDLCVDMARLEWEYVEIFDAEDSPPLDAAKLASIPEEAWQTARVILSKALSLLEVRYPVAELRRKLREEPDGHHPIPDRAEARLVLYRGADLSLFHRAVSPAAFAVLGELRGGVPLVPACERAAARVPGAAEEIESNASAWFLEWGQRGWVVDVETA